tara:strand:- start:5794 stop:5916 length:123 start_codon:yes stop_codon:yes gene_type:complete
MAYIFWPSIAVGMTISASKEANRLPSWAMPVADRAASDAE